VLLRRGLTILGTVWAWQEFAATASPCDRADARTYLAHLPLDLPAEDGAGRTPASGPATDPYAADPPGVPCPVCKHLTWRRGGSGWTCARCQPDPATSQLRPVPPMPVPRRWRAPQITTPRMRREITWALRGPRPSVATATVRMSSAAYPCARCGGHTCLHTDGADDESAVCTPVDGRGAAHHPSGDRSQ